MAFLLTMYQAYADITPTLTTGETAANVVGVTEVKATRTITVASLPADGVTLTIGTCVVTFSDAGDDTDEIDCDNNVAGISRKTATGGADTSRSASQIAAVIRSLTNVSDTGHGALTVAGSSATASFTTTGTEAAATVITATLSAGSAVTLTTVNTTGVIGVTAVAQAVTFTPAGISPSYTYTITLNGTAYTYSSPSSVTIAGIVGGLQVLANAASDVTCTEDDAKVTCTADSAGTAFTYSTTIAAAPPASIGGGGSGYAHNTAVVAPVVVTVPTLDLGCTAGNLFSSSTGKACSSTPASSSSIPSFVSAGIDLKIGTNDSSVMELQRYLNARDFTVAIEGVGSSGNETSYFGTLTKKALAKFQAAHGISATGYFGPITRGYIRANP